MLVKFTPACRHTRPLHRWNSLCRNGVPRLHYQSVFSGVVLKPAEDDQPIPWRLDLVAEQLEAVAEAKACDLAFDQSFRGLRQRPLRLANADCERAALGLAGLDQELAEEMRFSRAASAVNALVAGRLQQRLEYLRGRNFQDGQWLRSLALGQADAPAPHCGPVFVVWGVG